jgi:CHAT domain-containing protein/tetratricopeptide (TPR) repeat protein
VSKYQILEFILLSSLVLTLPGSGPRGPLDISHMQSFEDIVHALGPIRSCEGRLSGGFSYAPFPSKLNPSAIPHFAGLRTSLRRVFPDRESALIQLIQGNAAAATIRLQEAADREPSNAIILSDLSAAYLASAEEMHDPSAYMLALAAAERAVSLDGKLLVARFNFALALEKFFLTDKASNAWQEYLSLDKSSLWSVEAKARISRLNQLGMRELWEEQRPILESAALALDKSAVERQVSQFRQAARLYAEEVVLSNWADALDKGQKLSANRQLSIARNIGAALGGAAKDFMVQDAVAAIDESLKSSNGTRTLKLIKAHQAFRRGLELYRDQALQGARREFTKARVLFESADSPMGEWSYFYIAVCDYYALRYHHVFESLANLEKAFILSRYPVLHGRVLWMMGLSHFARTNLNDSLEYFQRSLRFFEIVGEAENISAINFLLAENYHYRGERQKAWIHRYRALAARKEILDPRRLVNILYDFADAALAEGQPRAARIFQDEQLKFALLGGSASSIAEAYHRRSKTYCLLRSYKESMVDLREAGRYSEKINEPGIRSRLRADIYLSGAELKRKISPGSAIQELSKALTFFRTSGFSLDEPQVMLSLAEIYEERGELDLAEKNLRNAVAWYRHRMNLGGGESGVGAVGGGATQAFQRLIGFEISRRSNGREAFELAEEARTRAVWDTVNASDLSPSKEAVIRKIEKKAKVIPGSEIQRQIPSNTIIIEYADMPDGVIAWAVDRSGLKVVKIGVSREALAQTIRRFRAELIAGSPQFSRDAKDLFAELLTPLIGPVLRGRHERKKLIIVPDGVLQGLPFAALRDPQSGKYAVEDFDIGTAPSAALYISSVSTRWPRAPKVLSIGASLFQREDFPWLASLPAAEIEARRVAAIYPGSRVLVGSRVTQSAFWGNLGAFDVIHFAGHALVNQEFPLESRLLISAVIPGESGEIFASDFYGFRFGRPKVVVLSACSSAGGEVQAFQGLSGLGRALLVNGVPAVVGTQWPVADIGTSQFLSRFHYLLLRGDGPVVALSEAQREALAGSGAWSQPLKWAAFQVMGDLSQDK